MINVLLQFTCASHKAHCLRNASPKRVLVETCSEEGLVYCLHLPEGEALRHSGENYTRCPDLIAKLSERMQQYLVVSKGQLKPLAVIIDKPQTPSMLSDAN